MGCIFLVLIVGLGFGWFYFWIWVISATAKFQLTLAPTLSGLNKLKHFLALSLLITLSFNVFSADNLPQLNKE
ncbi:hypothetical protein BCLUESOX_2394 [bacterium endosymbiont of Bathymodiolus sp. 5 South]|jgi:hypothetical protein|nr:hypothetical protein BCLUESOX_2394 [bacterium endosymbiont of Bathymodiolus sp. 5 South]VVM25712.1 hypothetical protein BSPWISOXPB_7748 [uncultured Gammaproteobacteria bacterium]